MKVKICGLTSTSDARMVVDAGADIAGCIVDVPVETPRKVRVGEAESIRKTVSNAGGLFCAVVMPSHAGEAVLIDRRLRPDLIQLHGLEPADLVGEIRESVDAKVVKAVHVDDDLDMQYVLDVSEHVDFLLLDTKLDGMVGGTGVGHSLEADREIMESTGKPCLIAGGGNAENVKRIADLIHPYGVDASSMLEEKPGVKDPAKVNALMEALDK